MLALAQKPSKPHPSLIDDGFAPHAQRIAQAGNDNRDSSLSETPRPNLTLPEAAAPAKTPWLDDPSYDTAAFLAGL